MLKRLSTRVYEAIGGRRTMKMVALIPARAGSKRIPGKNMRKLAGKPLLHWTIEAAKASGVFSEIRVCTEDYGIAEWCFEHGGQVSVIKRSESSATDAAPDIVWVRECLPTDCEQFAILRPTSPFRTAATIRRAYEQFRRTPDVHSLRAVEPVTQHPGKMWAWEGKGYPITPLLGYTRSDGTPWHSSPTQTLPTFYVQNASLEMAWTYVVTNLGSISGKKVLPFFMEGYEGFDLNTMDDWREAERLIAEGLVQLPPIPLARV